MSNASGSSFFTPQRLAWCAAVVIGASLLHWPHLPAWIPALLVGCILWRLGVTLLDWPLPPRIARLVLAFLAFMMVLGQYRTLNGLEAGSALLVLMVALKFLESRSQRDQLVLLIISYFLMFASLLYERGLPTLLYLLAFVWITTVGLLQLGRRGPLLPGRPTAKLAARLLVQALPIMIVLFLLFPRLPGPLWGVASATGAAQSGLSDRMSPGDITELGLSEQVAFRVEFTGPAPPPHRLYWRGPVLRDFNGRTWSRPSGMSTPPSESVDYRGEPTEYRVVLEPLGRNWAFALEMPRSWSRDNIRMGRDYQLRVLSFAPLRSRVDYRVVSHTEYRTRDALSSFDEQVYRRVPEDSSPRTHALMERWLAENPSPRALIARALALFAEEEFHYTLAPAALASSEPVDEFLFETRQGFCEHYASAFTVMMRLAGLPARVVTGYQGGELNPLGEYYIVRQADAHAWSEVWLEDEGWMRVDPTGAVAPERVAFGSSRAALGAGAAGGAGFTRTPWMRNVVLAWDAANAYWNEWFMGYGPELQRALLESFGLERPRWAELALLAAAATLTCLAALTLLLAWSQRRRPRQDAAARAFALFCRRLGRHGIEPPRPGEGPKAIAARAGRRLPQAAYAIGRVVDAYLAARYEPDASGTALARLQGLVRTFRIAGA